MSERIELSEHSGIVDGYLCTTDLTVAIAFIDSPKCQIGNAKQIKSGYLWSDSESDFDWPVAHAWRIPLSELPAIYGYRENDAWCGVDMDTGWIVVGDGIDGPEEAPFVFEVILRDSALGVCAALADSLRKLWEVIKEIEK